MQMFDTPNKGYDVEMTPEELQEDIQTAIDEENMDALQFILDHFTLTQDQGSLVINTLMKKHLKKYTADDMWEDFLNAKTEEEEKEVLNRKIVK